MSDIEHGPIINEIKQIHIIPGEGALFDGTVHYPEGLDKEEVRGIMADAHGVSEDNVMFKGEEPRNDVMRRANRLSVGFRRWNSSWDPRAQTADPSLN